MTAPLTVTWSHDPSILRGALDAWWSSAVPRPSISWRLIFWVLVWIGVLVTAVVLGALGLDPAYVLAGLAGIAVFIIGFFTLQRVRMRAFYRALGAHWDTAGDTTAVFTSVGIEVTDSVSQSTYTWQAVDAVAEGKRSTVIRIGISMIAIPDAALLDGMSGKQFRAALSELRKPGQIN